MTSEDYYAHVMSFEDVAALMDRIDLALEERGYSRTVLHQLPPSHLIAMLLLDVK